MNKLRCPSPLKKGDTIAFVAPSFGVTTEPYATRMEASLRNFQKEGFLADVYPNVYKDEGIAGSASPLERGKEINEAFASSSNAIVSVGGGETMVEILPYVDFEAIRKGEAKFFMGYSDNTNLTFLLNTLCDMVSIYGPHAGSFYARPFRYSEKDALRLLRGEKHFEGYPKYSITHNNPDHPLYRYRLTQEKIITPIGYETPIRGTLLGGCLDCLLSLCGTRFDKVGEFNSKHPEGIIWFLESCDLNAISIRRGLFQLKEAGWFSNAKGFLIGRPLHGEETFGTNPLASFVDLLGDLNVPILYSVDLGHIPPSLPLLSGAYCEAKLVNGNLVIDYL